MIIAEAYRLGDSDTLAPISVSMETGGDVGRLGDSRLFTTARASSAPDWGGFQLTLGAPIDVQCAELVHPAADAGTRVRFDLRLGGASVLTTPQWPVLNSETFAESGLADNSSLRPNLIVGLDEVAVGPAPGGALTSIQADRLDVQFLSAGSVAGWSAAYLALGHNGLQIPTQLDSVSVSLVDLQAGYGQGFEWTIRFSLLTLAAVDHIAAIFNRSRHAPAFLFPEPGSRGTYGGLSGSAASRGGLVRILSVDYDRTRILNNEARAGSLTLRAQSWQEEEV